MLSDGNFLFYFNLNNLSSLTVSLHSYIFLHIVTYLSLHTYSCLLHNHASLHKVTFLSTQLHFSSQYICLLRSHTYLHTVTSIFIQLHSPLSCILSYFFFFKHSHILHAAICYDNASWPNQGPAALETQNKYTDAVLIMKL